MTDRTKNSPGRERTEADRNYNIALAFLRVGVEQANAHLKTG
jgi:hypothetical protein